MIEYSGIDIGELNHNFLVGELGESYHSTVETAKSMLNDFADKIKLPTDLAANIEDNRVDLALVDLPVAAPIFDIGIKQQQKAIMILKILTPISIFLIIIFLFLLPYNHYLNLYKK